MAQYLAVGFLGSNPQNGGLHHLEIVAKSNKEAWQIAREHRVPYHFGKAGEKLRLFDIKLFKQVT